MHECWHVHAQRDLDHQIQRVLSSSDIVLVMAEAVGFSSAVDVGLSIKQMHEPLVYF